MNRKVWSYFEVARKLAAERKGNKSFLLAAIGHRADGAWVSATNSISQVPDRHLHAEKRVVKKLDQGATVYVARIRLLDGEFAMARPCPDCYKALQSRKVKRVFYTIDAKSYGVIDL